MTGNRLFPLPKPDPSVTDGGGGCCCCCCGCCWGVTNGGRFDLHIRSGPRDISSSDCDVDLLFVVADVGSAPDPDTDTDPDAPDVGVAVAAAAAAAPADICETRVRLWLLLNPVSFHFSETICDRDLVDEVRMHWVPYPHYIPAAELAPLVMPKGKSSLEGWHITTVL